MGVFLIGTTTPGRRGTGSIGHEIIIAHYKKFTMNLVSYPRNKKDKENVSYDDTSRIWSLEKSPRIWKGYLVIWKFKKNQHHPKLRKSVRILKNYRDQGTLNDTYRWKNTRQGSYETLVGIKIVIRNSK